ncbi:MAG: phosphoribosylformylglycinamidine synthase [Cyclobacteriaceae bacterium]
MILFFRADSGPVYGVGAAQSFSAADIEKLTWLLGGAKPLAGQQVSGFFLGPRKEMITPWSTNAVEITQNMGIPGILRMEEFYPAASADAPHDRMLQVVYNGLDQDTFTIHHQAESIQPVHDVRAYSEKEGLALNEEEIQYLGNVAQELGRPLTDSEVFGFSQVNSEHCRHKIFNGTFVIDGITMPTTLFQLIKKTSKENPGLLVSAYKDNVAFIKGPRISQFAPKRQDTADYFEVKPIDSVLSLKAETHNFPTTVEPFNGAATGSGGEIRDRLAGGRGSLPLAGTAVYITSYPRLSGGRPWEKKFPERKWLYQSPAEILIKASDGASDFGNKFGQPMIGGSVLTFEHIEGPLQYGFDKVIMLAGGIGFGKETDSQKGKLQAGDQIVLLGGDNYRIGMGGGAVSSVATGEYGNAIELNAIQRSNPEMQKRTMNAIRAMAELEHNPVVSIHDHGAGGHLNCFSELLEETGGVIHIDQLPIGDPTLSDKEVISNESQERMGIAIRSIDVDLLRRVAERERAPMYVVGEATGDHRYVFARKHTSRAVDLDVQHLIGSSPKTILQDQTVQHQYESPKYQAANLLTYLQTVLQMEAVACKDWLTNKVDRSVTGKVAMQQACGPLQLPLNNVAVMALDFTSNKGIATAIGHAPAAALVDPVAGSQLSIAEALTNLVWAPLTHGLTGVSLSANWMWPAKNKGENARLYQAVEAVSNFAIALGINIPTGKDSLSMTQKYPDGKVVISPGTVIISAMAECGDIRRCVSPALQPQPGSTLLYIDFSSTPANIGGSSFAQSLNALGKTVPTIADAGYFQKAFAAVQELIGQDLILAGHDIGSGGVITSVLEMCFATPATGVDMTLPAGDPLIHLFAENPGVIIQVSNQAQVAVILSKLGVRAHELGTITNRRLITFNTHPELPQLPVDSLRETWFETSFQLDALQRPVAHATRRKENIFQQELKYVMPSDFNGRFANLGIDPATRPTHAPRAAIIREKGVNGDREMAWSLYLAGFDVKDVHMTDLVSGREDLSDVQMIVFVGGFSNSDVLGSAKGWAGAFLYNPKAKASLDKFYDRTDTLSLGVCNGCQLMMELGLVYRDWKNHPRMHHNGSHRFESIFTSLTIPENESVMLRSLAGTTLGAWVAHGEGRFSLPPDLSGYRVAAHYTYAAYPGNPNDSDHAVAALYSADGRHLAIMPHIERALYPWNWPHYPASKSDHEIGPWIIAFREAVAWAKTHK